MGPVGRSVEEERPGGREGKVSFFWTGRGPPSWMSSPEDEPGPKLTLDSLYPPAGLYPEAVGRLKLATPEEDGRERPEYETFPSEGKPGGSSEE